jgi:hypothetical protein
MPVNPSLFRRSSFVDLILESELTNSTIVQKYFLKSTKQTSLAREYVSHGKRQCPAEESHPGTKP